MSSKCVVTPFATLHCRRSSVRHGWGMAATSGTYMLGPMSVWRSLTAKMRYDGAAWPPLATLARSSCGSIFVFVCGLEDIEWECAASTFGVGAAHSYQRCCGSTLLRVC